jgi:hypothetical protein
MKEIYIHVEELNGGPKVGRSSGARRRWGPGARSRARQPQQRVRVGRKRERERERLAVQMPFGRQIWRWVI